MKPKPEIVYAQILGRTMRCEVVPPKFNVIAVDVDTLKVVAVGGLFNTLESAERHATGRTKNRPKDANHLYTTAESGKYKVGDIWNYD